MTIIGLCLLAILMTVHGDQELCKDKEDCQFWSTLYAGKGKYLNQSLKCINYDKDKTASQQNQLEEPQEIYNLLRQSKILSIDESIGDLSMKFTWEQVWKDKRLKVPKKCWPNVLSGIEFPISMIDLIWNPKAANILGESVYETTTFTLDQKSYISTKYSTHVTLREEEFLLGWFPFDKHIYTLHVPQKIIQGNNLRNVLVYDTIGFHLMFNDWILSIAEKKSFVEEGTENGLDANFTIVELEFKIERQKANYLLNTYFPSMMLCIVSSGSLFIPSDVIPGRMGMSITSFLSLISLFNGARDGWTKSLSLRAIDIWIVLCQVGVFYTLIESCFVIYLTKMAKWEEPFISKKISATEMQEKVQKSHDLARKIESVSRIVLPCYNFLFFSIYFFVCLTV